MTLNLRSCLCFLSTRIAGLYCHACFCLCVLCKCSTHWATSSGPVTSLRDTWFNSLCNPDFECLCVVPCFCVTVIYIDFVVKRASVSCSSGSPQQCFLVGHSHSSLAYAVIRWVCPWVLAFGNLCSRLLGNGFKGFLRPLIELYRSAFATALSRIVIEGLKLQLCF